MNKEELFSQVLPQWEGRIHNVSVSTEPLANLAKEDIANMLRFHIYKAVESWDASRGMALSSWIFQAINQGRCSIIESNYTARKFRNRIVKKLPTTEEEEEEEEEYISSDPTPEEIVVNRITATELLQKLTKLFKGRDKKICKMIMSGDYLTDTHIANVLEVDFAIVGNVRLKMKVAYAVWNNIPLESFTRSKEVKKFGEKVRNI